MESCFDNKLDREAVVTEDIKIDLFSAFKSEDPCLEEREHLQVYLRIRPFTAAESERGESQDYITIESPDTVLLKAPSSSLASRLSDKSVQTGQRFQFSQVYGPETSQKDMFEGTVKSLVRDVLEGGNSLVFTYGVTNAGKTFTFLGHDANVGILPRSLKVIFNSIEEERVYTQTGIKPQRCTEFIRLTKDQQSEEAACKRNLLRQLKESDNQKSFSSQCSTSKTSLEVTGDTVLDMEGTENEDSFSLNMDKHTKFSIWVSFCEIYNENIHNLLEPIPSGGSKRTTLRLSQDVKGNSFVKDLRWVQVNSADEAYKVMKLGKRNQSISCTKLNQLSSRSHSIFSIRIIRIQDVGTPRVQSISELSLCDLAGSERCAKTQNQGERLKEAGNINTSLLTLGKCITALRNKQQSKLLQHVPFRESKLTHYLQGFFCGRGRACMIVNINQCASMCDETLNVLKFSAVAQKVVVLTTKPLPVGPRGSARELSFIINNADRKALWATLNGRRKSSIVGRDSSLEDVQEDEDVCFHEDDEEEEEEEESVMEETELESESEDEDEDVEDQTCKLSELKKAEGLALEARVREEVTKEFSELFTEMQNDFEERLVKEKEIIEERAERRLEILKNLVSKNASQGEGNKADQSLSLDGMIDSMFSDLDGIKEDAASFHGCLGVATTSDVPAPGPSACGVELVKKVSELAQQLREAQELLCDKAGELETNSREAQKSYKLLEEHKKKLKSQELKLHDLMQICSEKDEMTSKLQATIDQHLEASSKDRMTLDSIRKEMARVNSSCTCSRGERPVTRTEARKRQGEEQPNLVGQPPLKKGSPGECSGGAEEGMSRLCSALEERSSEVELHQVTLTSLSGELEGCSASRGRRQALEDGGARQQEAQRVLELPRALAEATGARQATAREPEDEKSTRALAALEEERQGREEALATLKDERRGREEALAALEEERQGREEALATHKDERRGREEALAALEEERQGREEALATLKDERRGREEALAALEEERQGREEALASLKDERRGREEALAALEEERQGREEALATLKDERRGREEAAAALKDERRGREEDLATLKGERRGREEALAALEEERQGREEALATLKDERRGREEALAALEEERQGREEALATLKDERRGREEAAAALKDERRGREEAAAALKEERRGREEAAAALKEERRGREEALATLKDERRGREEAAAALEQQNEENSRLAQKTHQTGLDTDLLLKVSQDLGGKLEATLKEVGEQAARADKSSAELEAAQAQLEKCTQEIQEKSSLILSLTQDVLHLKQQVEDRSSQGEEMAGLLRDLSAAVGESERGQRQVQALDQELERVNEQRAQMRVASEQAVEQLKQQLSEQKLASEQLSQQLQEKLTEQELASEKQLQEVTETLSQQQVNSGAQEEQLKNSLTEQKLASHRGLEELRQKLKEQELASEKLMGELREQLAEHVQTSEKQLDELRGKVGEPLASHRQLEEEELKSLNSELQDEVTPLRAKRERLLKEREEMVTKLTEKEVQVSSLQRSLREAQERKEEEESLAVKEARRREVERRRELLAVAEEAIAQKDAELEKRAQEITRLKEVAKQDSDRVKSISLDLQRKEDDTSDLKEKLADSKKQIQQVQKEISSMREEERVLRQKLQDMEKTKKQLHTDLATRDRTLLQLKSEPSSNPKADELYQKACKDLQDRDGVIEGMRVALTEQEETQDQMEQALEEKLDQIQQLTDEVEKIKRMLSDRDEGTDTPQLSDGQVDSIKLAKQEVTEAQESLQLCVDKHQADRRKWLEEKMVLIRQAKEAEDKRNQEMRKFAEDRERHTKQQSQLESLSAQLSEKDRDLLKWRQERDGLVSALEVQLKKLLTSNGKKDQLIEQLRCSGTPAPPEGSAVGTEELQTALSDREAEIVSLKEQLALSARAPVTKPPRPSLPRETASQQSGGEASPAAAGEKPRGEVSRAAAGGSCPRASVSSQGSGASPSVLDWSQISTENGRASRFPKPELEISFSPLQPNRMALRRQGEDSTVTVKISRSARKRKSGEMEKEVDSENRTNTRTRLTPKLAPHKEEGSPAGSIRDQKSCMRPQGSQSSVRSKKEGALQKIGVFLHSSPTLFGTKAKKMMGLVSGRCEESEGGSSPSAKPKKSKRNLYCPEISSPMDVPAHSFISRDPTEKDEDNLIIKRRLRTRTAK
ncbi:uncharacterized protein kif20ba [Aplochiton taeniatus]